MSSSWRAARNLYSHPQTQAFLWSIKGLAVVHVMWFHVYCWSPTWGPSMLPTFEVAGDTAVIDRSRRRGRGVEVGDLVAYDIPVERGSLGVKRVTGMPGDYVLMNSPESGSDKMVQVPLGHCWLMGDNLAASRDSRHYGPVPLALIHGKVVGTMFPWKRFKNIFTKPAQS